MVDFSDWISELKFHLENELLPFWMEQTLDDENGGFIGRISGDEKKHTDAIKGAVLNARILWTFSAAYRVLKNDTYLKIAIRAKDYFAKYFIDKENGGVYWSVDCQGNPINKTKYTYAIGFAIYAYSEFFRATGDEEAKTIAVSLFNDIEGHCYDPDYKGFFEAFSETWGKIEDMRLSEKDENMCKTMNTHLHVLEPYTNLYRVWKSPILKLRLRELILIFLEKIIDPNTYHFNLYFDNEWQTKANLISYGHDIEISWLLHEAAIVLGENEIISKVEAVIPKVIKAVNEGIYVDGSMVYEKNRLTQVIDFDRHWWVQAEAVVGFYNYYHFYHNEQALKKAISMWQFIKNTLINYDNGEWYWSIDKDGRKNTQDDKVGFWKCPYHHARMCLELIEKNSDNHLEGNAVLAKIHDGMLKNHEQVTH